MRHVWDVVGKYLTWRQHFQTLSNVHVSLIHLSTPGFELEPKMIVITDQLFSQVTGCFFGSLKGQKKREGGASAAMKNQLKSNLVQTISA